MTDFKTPGLCGSNETINAALQKLEELETEIASQIDAVASDAAAAIDTKLTELTAALDSLLPELPSAPPVNLQAEITNTINSFDKSTAAGVAKFNTAVAKIQQDFGDALDEAGVKLDDLMTQAETAIGGGGDVCGLVGNFELPAANSGTGTTTETVEERASGTSVSSITLTQIPKKIVSVLGKKQGTNFFGGVSYTQSGKTITIKSSTTGTVFTEIKVSYTISLIKEKPVAVKQATEAPETEEVSIVIKNVKSEEANATSKYNSLIKKFNDATTAGIPSDGIDNAFSQLTSTLQSDEFKEQMDKDFAAAKVEYAKIAQDPLKYKTITVPQGNTSSVSSTANETTVAQEEKKVRTVKVTTTEDRNTVTQEQTTITTSGGESTTITAPKTEKTVISENGFTSRKNYVSERFINFSDIEELTKIRKSFGTTKYQIVDRISSGIELKQTPLTIESVSAVSYSPKRAKFFYDVLDDSDKNSITPVIADLDDDGKEIPNSKKVFFVSRPNRKNKNVSVRDIQVLIITYTVLEKIDPNFKG